MTKRSLGRLTPIDLRDVFQPHVKAIDLDPPGPGLAPF